MSRDSSHLPSPGVRAYWDSKASPRFSLLDHRSTRGSAQQLTVVRRAVDDELSALHAIMCRMRSTRNNFSLIARLPPEILSCVFAFHVINQPPLGGDPLYDRDSPDRGRDHDHDHIHNYDYLYPSLPSDLSPTRFRLGWITVTHVCHHWRQVALSNSSLWRTIVFDLGAEWAEEMLARSRAAPISYRRRVPFRPRIPSGKTLDDEVVLREHLSHIRQLALSGDADFLAPTLRALTTPAPNLEAFELLPDGPLFRQECVLLPSNIFSHQAPKLRHITLLDCSIPWDSSVFCDLTHLDVRLPTVPFSRAAEPQPDPLMIPSLERLLSILEAVPYLQILTLQNCLPPPSFTNRVVELQYLTRLSLEGSLPEIVAVLKLVSLPGSTSISLRCLDDNPLDESLDALTPFLSTHFRAPGHSIPFSTLTIGHGDYLTIGAWDTDVSVHHPKFPPKARARLLLKLGCRHHALFELLPLRLCKALPLRNLRAFATVCPLLPWTPTDWRGMSSLCPQVAHLLVDSPAAAALAPTLTENTTFPALVGLVFKSVNFSTLLSWNEDQGTLYMTMPTLLRTRRAVGIPVQRVELEQCVADDMLLYVFSQFVDHVISDKDVGKDTDSDFTGSVSDFSWEWDI